MKDLVTTALVTCPVDPNDAAITTWAIKWARLILVAALQQQQKKKTQLLRTSIKKNLMCPITIKDVLKDERLTNKRKTSLVRFFHIGNHGCLFIKLSIGNKRQREGFK
jgi:hypothetical protein